MAHIMLKRKILTDQSTVGLLSVFGNTVWTLEDTKREHKVYGETRIPAGTYKLELRTEGGMNARYTTRFPEMHRGMIWLRHVPMFEHIYIHPGNTANDTLGCILVGLQTAEDRLISSVAAYKRIYPLICDAIEGDGCHIIINDEETEYVH